MLPWVMISVLSGSPFPTIALYVHDLVHYDTHMWRGCSSRPGQFTLYRTLEIDPVIETTASLG